MNIIDVLTASTCLSIPLGAVAVTLAMGSGSRAGVYVYRTRKPTALLGLPVVGRHFAYVGQTKSFGHRHRQHIGRPLPFDPYARTGQAWADLQPRCYRIPLPAIRPLLLVVEWLLIKCLLPVYNVKHNRGNPRKITAYRALQMRSTRDKVRLVPSPGRWAARMIASLRWYHYVATVLAVSFAVGWLA